MSAHPDIETLRQMVKRDQDIFRAQNQRLTEVQQSNPETLSDVDRNSLSNWDKSVVKDCNHQLSVLEEIAEPTAEERVIMQELNKLISLGDHIMERRNVVQTELNNRLNAMKRSARSKAKSEEKPQVSKSKPALDPAQKPQETIPEHSRVVDSPAIHLPENPIPSAATEIPESPPVTGAPPEPVLLIHANDDLEGFTFDPKDLYAVIKVEHDAPLSEVKRAAKKATLLLHPDRQPGDPNASSRFANFQIACQAFETEGTRQEFDETGDVKAFPNLRRGLKALTMEK